MFKLQEYVRNYYKKKSWFSLLSDLVFISLVILLIIPSTRTDVATFFIRLTSLPPSALEPDEQYIIKPEDRQWLLYDTDGNTVRLNDLLGNEKPVLINFWATWCPPCVAEMPQLKSLYDEYGEQVNFVFASTESLAQQQKFSSERSLNLPFYSYRNTPVSLQSTTIPATFVIDRNGRIVLAKKGAARWNSDRMHQLLDQLSK